MKAENVYIIFYAINLVNLGGNNINQSNQYTNPLSEYEKKEILRLHDIGVNNIKIAERIGRSDSTIGRYLKKCGLKTFGNRLFTNGEIKDILNSYENGETASMILERYKYKVKCPETIMYTIKKYGGTPRRSGTQVSYNTSYFHDIDTEAKAYYLGFFLADGNVHQLKRNENQYRIQIDLQSQDEYILKQFNEEIGSSNAISHYRKNGRDEVMLQLHSREMANDLMLHVVYPRKSMHEELTNTIPQNLFHHYIRGIFDGDGTVYILNNKYHQLKFGFYGSHKLVEQIHHYLQRTINISDNKIYDKTTVSFSNYSRYNDIINFYHLIYDDSHLFLTRKRNKFLEYFQYKNKQIA